MDDYKMSMALNNSEYISVSAIEITSVPDISILRENYAPNADIETEIRFETGSLLMEVYQSYQTFISDYPNAGLAVEVLWLTEAVENQPYRARIRIFTVARAISYSRPTAEAMADQVISECDAALRLHKYGTMPIEASKLQGFEDNIPDESLCSILKDERLENLQNRDCPVAYSYDRFDGCAHDLGSFINSMIEHPDCMVSFQILPTSFSRQEVEAVSQTVQILDTLHRKGMTQGTGTAVSPEIESLSSVYKYYSLNKNNPLFTYGILIRGRYRSVEDISSKLFAYLTYDTGRAPALEKIYFKEGYLTDKANFSAQPWMLQETLIHRGRSADIQRHENEFDAFYRLPFIITVEEATELFRFPIGTQRISAGLTVNDTDSVSKTYANNLINAGDIEVGVLKSSGNRDTIGISLNDLAKHMLVAGTPGSGKTTFCIGLLDRLWKEYHIPFLVIEPAKNEYRALAQSIPDLQVFTPGKNFISPFVFNPFIPPKNVRLETYKSTLKTAFAAAVSMTTPLDKIFEETINNCYSDFKWLDSYTSDDKGQIFNISDFIKCFQDTFDEIGYTGDALNIGRAGMVRLNSLVNLFDNYGTIPIEDMLQKPTVIELAAIENSDQKALIISLLLLSVLSYVNANYVGEGGLRNVILLEEAHVLLDAESNSGDANPSAIAQNLVKRMLAEIRSYGVGLIIADQSPRKVTTDVVALTDMKLIFRLVESADKQIVADSMNMSDAQVKRVSRLKPGEAFLFFNRLDEPEEVITPDYRLENNISITLTDSGIRELSTYWSSRQKTLRPYPQCDYVPYCSEDCDYQLRILAKEISRRIFVKNFKSSSKDFEDVKNVFSKITKLTIEESNDEPFSPRLLSCVKCQLWRRIRYGTKIQVREIQVENSLKKK